MRAAGASRHRQPMMPSQAQVLGLHAVFDGQPPQSALHAQEHEAASGVDVEPQLSDDVSHAQAHTFGSNL